MHHGQPRVQRAGLVHAGRRSGRDFVREHSPRFARLLQETFQQFEHYPEEWKAFREWFYDLPLFLETSVFAWYTLAGTAA